MSYMQSNQPYGRVVEENSGLGGLGGAAIGATLGLAGAGAAHRWGEQGIQVLKDRGLGSQMGRQRELSQERTQSMSSAQNNKERRQIENDYNKREGRMDRKFAARMDNLDQAGELRGKAFGGGLRGKALAYGGSAVAGGLLGGVLS